MADEQQQESSPTTLHKWAESVIYMEQLAGGSYRKPPFRSLPGLEHPAIITQAAFEETFRPGVTDRNLFGQSAHLRTSITI